MAKPVLRLKGFEGEWKAISFHESFSFLKNYSLSRDELSEEGKVKNVHYGDVLIKFGELLDVSKEQLPFVKDNDLGIALAKERSLENGDIIFADAAEDNTVGKCVEILGLTCNDKMISGLHTIPCRPSKEFEKGYLGYYLNSCKFHDQLLPHIQGTKVSSISKKAIESTTVFCPQDCKEQKAITDYFKSLDSMILATTKKIASLKQMKSASLISMFPQAGETKPRVRFKGFTEEWDNKVLNECLDISKERNTDSKYGKDDVLSVSDDFGVMNQIELLGRSYAGKSVSNYGILEHGQIVYTKSPLKSKPYGIVKENTGETGIVSVLYAVYTAKENTWIPYIHYYFDPAWRLNAYLRPLINKGAKNTMNISDETALTGYIMIPKDIKEQQRIADYFRSLDKQISLQEQRLEKLKQIKAACLDKMFV